MFYFFILIIWAKHSSTVLTPLHLHLLNDTYEYNYLFSLFIKFTTTFTITSFSSVRLSAIISVSATKVLSAICFLPFSPYRIPFSPLTYKKNTHHSIVELVQIFAHVIFRSNSPSLKQLLICIVITVLSLPKSSTIWFVLNQNRFIFHFYLKFDTSILLRISIHINSNNLSIQQK